MSSWPGVASIFYAQIGEWQIILRAKVTIHPQGPRGAVLSLFEAGELNVLNFVTKIDFFNCRLLAVAVLSF